MKNGDLNINGQLARNFIPEDQLDHYVLLEFEFASYSAYDAQHGPGACVRDGIDTLADLYGQEFSDRVFRARVKLIAQKKIGEVRERIARDTAKVANLQKLIDNPTTNLEDVFNI